MKKPWFEETKEVVNGIVRLEKKGYGRKGVGFDSKWSVNLEELARITNEHPEFNEKVRGFLDKNADSIHNMIVYRSFNKNDENREHISIVFDVCDIYISMFSCCPDYHDGRPHVLDASYNKSYVWQMATMLGY